MSEITTIRFDGDNLQTVRDDKRVWVVVKRVCEALGVDWEGQRQRLRDESRCPWAVACMTQATGNDGKSYEMFCVDLDTLPMWLATIDVGRVKPGAREKLIAYQRECARVLRDHFFGARPSAVADVALAPVAAALSAMAAVLSDLQRQVAWLVANTGLCGALSVPDLRRLRAEAKSIAALEAAGGRHKNTRAASADLYREMGRIVNWGGKGQPWDRLPSQLMQPAMAVLDGRRCDAERVLCARRSNQLHLVNAAQNAR